MNARNLISAAVSAALAADHAADHAAVVISPNGETVRTVHNLGWLMRHKADLRLPSEGPAFTLRAWRYGAAPPVGSYGYSPIDGRPHLGPIRVETHSPVLVAHFSDGHTYAAFATTFADAGVLFDWLARPSFMGYSATVDLHHSGTAPSTCAIGGLDWSRHVAELRMMRARVALNRLYAEHPAELTTNRRDRPSIPSPELLARLAELRADNQLAELALDMSALRSAYRRADKRADAEHDSRERAFAVCAETLGELLNAVGAFLAEPSRARRPSTTTRTPAAA